MLSKHYVMNIWFVFIETKTTLKPWLWCAYRGLNTNKGTGNRKWVALGQGHLLQAGVGHFNTGVICIKSSIILAIIITKSKLHLISHCT